MTPATLFDQLAKIKQDIEEYIVNGMSLDPLSEAAIELNFLLDDLAKEGNTSMYQKLLAHIAQRDAFIEELTKLYNDTPGMGYEASVYRDLGNILKLYSHNELKRFVHHVQALEEKQ